DRNAPHLDLQLIESVRHCLSRGLFSFSCRTSDHRNVRLQAGLRASEKITQAHFLAATKSVQERNLTASKCCRHILQKLPQSQTHLAIGRQIHRLENGPHTCERREHLRLIFSIYCRKRSGFPESNRPVSQLQTNQHILRQFLSTP